MKVLKCFALLSCLLVIQQMSKAQEVTNSKADNKFPPIVDIAIVYSTASYELLEELVVDKEYLCEIEGEDQTFKMRLYTNGLRDTNYDNVRHCYKVTYGDGSIIYYVFKDIDALNPARDDFTRWSVDSDKDNPNFWNPNKDTINLDAFSGTKSKLEVMKWKILED